MAGVKLTERLHLLFGQAVQRDRPARHLLGLRRHRRVAVDRRARQQDDARLGRVQARVLEQRERRRVIGGELERRMGRDLGHRAAAGGVDDQREPLAAGRRPTPISQRLEGSRPIR